MINRIILHIGTPKSGSTSIQEFLKANKHHLQESGTYYLHTKQQHYVRSLVIASMNPSRNDYFTKNNELYSQNDRETWNAEVLNNFDLAMQQVPKSIHTLILSCEGFFGQLSGCIEELSTLKSILSKYSENIKVIVYLRRQDEMSVSLYSSKLRLGSTKRELLSPKPSFDYYKNLCNWSAVFGRKSIKARIFDKNQLSSYSLIDDFIKAAEITLPNYDKPFSTNETLSVIAQEVLRILNLGFSNFLQHKPNRKNQILKEYITEVINSEFSGSGLLPSRSEAEEFMKQYKESNAKLHKEFFKGETLFSDDYTNYPVNSIIPEIPEKALSLAFSKISEFEIIWRKQLLHYGVSLKEHQTNVDLTELLLSSKLAYIEGYRPSHRILPIRTGFV